MFLMNLLYLASPSKRVNEANGSGRGGNGGIFTLPALQQLLYIGCPFVRAEPCLRPSRSQKIAWQ